MKAKLDSNVQYITTPISVNDNYKKINLELPKENTYAVTIVEDLTKDALEIEISEIKSNVGMSAGIVSNLMLDVIKRNEHFSDEAILVSELKKIVYKCASAGVKDIYKFVEMGINAFDNSKEGIKQELAKKIGSMINRFISKGLGYNDIVDTLVRTIRVKPEDENNNE